MFKLETYGTTLQTAIYYGPANAVTRISPCPVPLRKVLNSGPVAGVIKLDDTLRFNYGSRQNCSEKEKSDPDTTS